MDPNELLVRTMNAARDAREKGFDKTADAFEEIVESMLDLLSSRSNSQNEVATEPMLEFYHFH